MTVSSRKFPCCGNGTLSVVVMGLPEYSSSNDRQPTFWLRMELLKGWKNTYKKEKKCCNVLWSAGGVGIFGEELDKAGQKGVIRGVSLVLQIGLPWTLELNLDPWLCEASTSYIFFSLIRTFLAVCTGWSNNTVGRNFHFLKVRKSFYLNHEKFDSVTLFGSLTFTTSDSVLVSNYL